MILSYKEINKKDFRTISHEETLISGENSRKTVLQESDCTQFTSEIAALWVEIKLSNELDPVARYLRFANIKRIRNMLLLKYRTSRVFWLTGPEASALPGGGYFLRFLFRRG